MRAKLRITSGIGLLLVAISALPQEPLTISDPENLPPASLWESYTYRLQASGGAGPYDWSLLGGSLPRGLQVRDLGELTGVPDESGLFEFTLLVRDGSKPVEQQKKKFFLSIQAPLVATWDRRVSVSGHRIDGSIKVSNRSGRDFDLTVVVLAVNDIGRATAIGYQHFPLKKNTRDLDITFGDTVSQGSYAVNVDVVAEEPISSRIFRARLVTDRQQVTQGP